MSRIAYFFFVSKRDIFRLFSDNGTYGDVTLVIQIVIRLVIYPTVNVKRMYLNILLNSETRKQTLVFFSLETVV